MALISPKNNDLIGSLIRLHFDNVPTAFDLEVNDVDFHVEREGDDFIVDVSEVHPDQPVQLNIFYRETIGVLLPESVTVKKPPHDLGGMGATVIRNSARDIIGVFFKFWLPQVAAVFVRGRFNRWMDKDKLHQLGETGYWYGFVPAARPGDDYRFFVYARDGNFQEVSDPAARDTIITRHNEPEDAQDANAVIIDPSAFTWLHDASRQAQRSTAGNYIIYQAHWGTFFREGEGILAFEPFVRGTNEAEKRAQVRNKLTHISNLGFTVLQLLPVHEANGNFNAGYDPSFYFAIESAYGKPDDLRILVDEAHGLGLAVIVDIVINHLTNEEKHSSFSQPFIKGWYTKKDAPWSNQRQFGGNDWGPDPDFERQEIQNLLADSIRMYFDEFHVDGIRMDATTTIPREALRAMIAALKNQYAPQSKFFIAEHITNDPFPYIIGEIHFDAGWCKSAWYDCVGDVLGHPGQGSVSKLKEMFTNAYLGGTTTLIKYLLGSHDENWSDHKGIAAVNHFGGKENFFGQSKMRLAYALNLSMIGVPMIFMGNELMTPIAWHNYYGYNGGNVYTPGAGLDWNPPGENTAGKFGTMVRKINALRLQHDALRGNANQTLLVHEDQANGVVGYKRWDDAGAVLLVLINISDHQWSAQEYEVETRTPHASWEEIFNSQDLAFGGWADSGNASSAIHADASGRTQGINLPQWSLLMFKQRFA